MEKVLILLYILNVKCISLIFFVFWTLCLDRQVSEERFRRRLLIVTLYIKARKKGKEGHSHWCAL